MPPLKKLLEPALTKKQFEELLDIVPLFRSSENPPTYIQQTPIRTLFSEVLKAHSHTYNKPP